MPACAPRASACWVAASSMHAHLLAQKVYRLRFWPDFLLFGKKVGSIFVQQEDDTGLPSFKVMS